MNDFTYYTILGLFTLAQICRGHISLQYWTGIRTQVETVHYSGWIITSFLLWCIILFNYEPTFTYVAIIIASISTFTSLPLKVFKELYDDQYFYPSRKYIYLKLTMINVTISGMLSIFIDISTHRALTYHILITPVAIFTYLILLFFYLHKRHLKKYVPKSTIYTSISLYHLITAYSYYYLIHYTDPFVILRG
jgi:hypothetical protein